MREQKRKEYYREFCRILWRKPQEKASLEEIREALNSLNFAEVEIENQQFLLKIKKIELSNKILKLLKIKPPKNITPKEELSL